MDAVFSIAPTLDKTEVVNLEGWEPNLKVLYSVDIHAGVSYLCWKIQNTEQIFKIQATLVFEKHGLKFLDHFLITLKTFREDYKEWEKLEFPEPWMQRYNQIFHQLIK